MRSWLRTVSITLTAALATAAVASLLQTQINLHALTQLGLDVSWPARAAVTVEDLARFGPVMFNFSLAGGVLASCLQPILRRLGLHALPCALLAGVAGLAVVLAVLRSVIPMPAKGWQGDLLVPALRDRSIRRLVRDGDRVVRQERLLVEMGERIRDVMVAADGSVYALTDGVDGKLLRLVPEETL